jgi:hypothetical protein
MPISRNPPQKRDYKKEEHYEDTPAQVKHREERNLLRAHMAARLGHAPAGDVAHIVPLDSGGTNSLGNSRVESVHKNRSWRKGQRKYAVPVDKL